MGKSNHARSAAVTTWCFCRHREALRQNPSHPTQHGRSCHSLPRTPSLIALVAQVPQVSTSQCGMKTGSPILLVMCSTVGLCAKGGDAGDWTREVAARLGILATPLTYSLQPWFPGQTPFLGGELLVKCPFPGEAFSQL